MLASQVLVLAASPLASQASDQVAAKLTGTHLSWNYPILSRDVHQLHFYFLNN